MEQQRTKYFIDMHALTHADDPTIWWRSLQPYQVKQSKTVPNAIWENVLTLLANPDQEIAKQIKEQVHAVYNG